MYQEQHHTQPLPGATQRAEMYAELAPTEVLPALPPEPPAPPLGRHHARVMRARHEQVVKALAMLMGKVDVWEECGQGPALTAFLGATEYELPGAAADQLHGAAADEPGALLAYLETTCASRDVRARRRWKEFHGAIADAALVLMRYNPGGAP